MKEIDSMDLFLIIIAFGFFILLTFAGISNLPLFETEEDCVSYYLNNDGYILEKCEEYDDKLLELNPENIE